MYLNQRPEAGQLAYLIRHRLIADEHPVGGAHLAAGGDGHIRLHLFDVCAYPQRSAADGPPSGPLPLTVPQLRERITDRRTRVCDRCRAGCPAPAWWRPWERASEQISWAMFAEDLLDRRLTKRVHDRWDPHLVEQGLRTWLLAAWPLLGPVTDPALADHLTDTHQRVMDFRPRRWHRHLLRREREAVRSEGWVTVDASPLTMHGPDGFDEENWLMLATLGTGSVEVHGGHTIARVDLDRVHQMSRWTWWRHQMRIISRNPGDYTADDIAAAVTLDPDLAEAGYGDLLRALAATRS